MTTVPGIGAIPDSALSAMKGHKNLGIHTEMMGDGVIELIKLGVVNNSCKSLHKGKVVTSFAVGTRDLYDFVDGNPVFGSSCNDQ